MKVANVISKYSRLHSAYSFSECSRRAYSFNVNTIKDLFCGCSNFSNLRFIGANEVVRVHDLFKMKIGANNIGNINSRCSIGAAGVSSQTRLH